MEVLYPVIALVALTLFMGFSVGISRMISARNGSINPRYFKLMSGFDVPDHIVQIGRNYTNLLEMPVLFYVVCVLSLVLNVETAAMTAQAWAYVGLRLVHTTIHVTYNHPIHRFMMFLISTLCLIAMWVELFYSIPL